MPWFPHIPGIKVVAPSNPYDAKMVLIAAIESDDPVLYFENKILYKEKGELPEIADQVPYTLGKARVEREGSDVTIVSYSIGMKNARGAADLLAKDGIKAEVIDLITLSPWDKETVLNSVKKTHRLCIVHEAVKQSGFGAEIAATVAEEAMEYMDAPILRYGAPFCPIPFAPTLEKMVRVYPEDLYKGIKGMKNHSFLPVRRRSRRRKTITFWTNFLTLPPFPYSICPLDMLKLKKYRVRGDGAP